MAIRRCPTCGSRRISRRTVTLKVTVRGKKAEVPNLSLEVCPDCGEKLSTWRPRVGWRSDSCQSAAAGRQPSRDWWQ